MYSLKTDLPKEHFHDQLLIFPSAFSQSLFLTLQEKPVTDCISQMTPTIFQVPHTLQYLATTPSRCGVMSLPFVPKQTFLPFQQGSVVKINVFSLWVECDLRNELYWPMWRCSEFRCVVKQRESSDSFCLMTLPFFLMTIRKNTFWGGEQCESKREHKGKSPYFQVTNHKVACLIQLRIFKIGIKARWVLVNLLSGKWTTINNGKERNEYVSNLSQQHNLHDSKEEEVKFYVCF